MICISNNVNVAPRENLLGLLQLCFLDLLW